MLNSSGERGQPCLIPDLGKKEFILSILRIMIAVGFLQTSFIGLKKYFLILSHTPHVKSFVGEIEEEDMGGVSCFSCRTPSGWNHNCTS